jgi:hypothetical protein
MESFLLGQVNGSGKHLLNASEVPDLVGRERRHDDRAGADVVALIAQCVRDKAGDARSYA